MRKLLLAQEEESKPFQLVGSLTLSSTLWLVDRLGNGRIIFRGEDTYESERFGSVCGPFKSSLSGPFALYLT